MSDKQTGPDSQRNPSANKNVRKLRTISMVCGLMSSWQQWAADNERKQASEPSGWSPASLGGPTEEPRRTWVPKNRPPQREPTSAQEAQKRPEGGPAEPPAPSRIRTKQVVRTVTSGAQEKSAGVALLTQVIQKEAPPSGEEIDRLLKKKSSPTRRRKCSNVVASLTRSWKQVESEERLGKDGGGRGKGGGEGSEAERDTHEVEETQPGRTRDSKGEEEEQKDTEEDLEFRVRIKRSTVSSYKKEADDANKIQALSKSYSAVGNLKSRWQDWASEHSVSQKLNPFSEYFDYDYSMSARLQRGQEGYGRPKEGSKTAERARRAERHIHREIDDMCYVIRTMVDPDPDGRSRVTFGQLFDRYVRISDKVVGILMRARKHGKVAFEGEMLWQGRDDGVVITLLV
ncbi:actin binding Rho activating protein b [Betta splendens]|uniref:Actin-binding Rho-activating protein n=1 Tax=Betta splendens TaxID=158456 RepID=A0A6P7P1C5_BETSP|nr:actin binding Rho activating protein b [Betta splendens]